MSHLSRETLHFFQGFSRGEKPTRKRLSSGKRARSLEGKPEEKTCPRLGQMSETIPKRKGLEGQYRSQKKGRGRGGREGKRKGEG